MDLLIAEPFEAEVTQWLAERLEIRVAAGLAQATPSEWRGVLRDVRGVIVPPSVAVDAFTLASASHLRAVGQVSVGAENVDVEACVRLGIEVVRCQSAVAPAEAEFVIGTLVTLMRRTPVVTSTGMLVGRELGAAKVGLIGMGPTAQKLAPMLSAFGAKVAGYDPSVHANDPIWPRANIEPLSLPQLFEQCDAIVVLLTWYSRYRGLIGERLLTAIAPDQVIINLSHSAVFDEVALARGLHNGRIGAAWFDSMEPDALHAGRPLSDAPNLQVTPRLAGTTRESRLRSAWSVARCMADILLHSPQGVRRQEDNAKPSLPGELLDLG